MDRINFSPKMTLIRELNVTKTEKKINLKFIIVGKFYFKLNLSIIEIMSVKSISELSSQSHKVDLVAKIPQYLDGYHRFLGNFDLVSNLRLKNPFRIAP